MLFILANFALFPGGSEGVRAWLVDESAKRSGWCGPGAAFGALIRAFRGARRLFDEIRDASVARLALARGGNRAPEFGSPLRCRRAATADRLCGAPGSCSSYA